MATELQREFPQSADAERGVLASFLLSPVDVRAICARLGVTKEWFYLPAHAEIFETLCRIADGGEAVDFITIAQALKDAGSLDRIGGPAYLNELTALLPSAANVRDYLDILAEKYIRRQMIEAMTIGLRDAYDAHSAEESLASCHGALSALLRPQIAHASVADELQAIVDEIREGKDEAGLLPSGVEGVDGRLKLFRGDLLIISAPTSCGKTALAAQLAWGYAMKGHRVAIYPLEMKQRRVLKRAISQLGGHNADFVRQCVQRHKSGLMPEEKLKPIIEQFMATARTVKAMKLHIRDRLSRWEQIAADLRVEHALNPFAFALIDYLQLVKSDTRHEREQIAIADITQRAKLLAMELDCIICLPSQVNQQGGTRGAQDPENDADALAKIHGEVDDKGDTRPGRVSIWKQRDGERHIDLPLRFNAALTRFEYLDQQP